MKTKLPEVNKDLPNYNYDFRLSTGLYISINLKLVKLNCKNYQINSNEEITISTNNGFSILTIRMSRKSRVQYLVRKELKTAMLDSIPERYLPNGFKDYIVLAHESILNYELLRV